MCRHTQDLEGKGDELDHRYEADEKADGGKGGLDNRLLDLFFVLHVAQRVGGVDTHHREEAEGDA